MLRTSYRVPYFKLRQILYVSQASSSSAAIFRRCKASGSQPSAPDSTTTLRATTHSGSRRAHRLFVQAAADADPD